MLPKERHPNRWWCLYHCFNKISTLHGYNRFKMLDRNELLDKCKNVNQGSLIRRYTRCYLITTLTWLIQTPPLPPYRCTKRRIIRVYVAIFYPFQRGFINFFLMIKHNVAPKGLKAFNTTLYNANIQLKLLLNQNL